MILLGRDTLEILIDKCINYNYKLVYGSYSRDLKEFKMAKKKIIIRYMIHLFII